VPSFHCLRRIYIRRPTSSLSPHPWTSLTSRPSTLYFRATRFPCALMLRHAFLLERSRTIKYPSLHLQLAGDEKRSHAPPCSSTSWETRGRRCHRFHRISNRPGWACRRSTQRTPISWLRLTASSLPTSGEGEGSEPPGTRVARLKRRLC
jgi:hypothetical protein